MKEFKGIKFSTSLGILYDIKEKHNHTTLNETYKVLEKSDADSMIEVLTCSYNDANKANLNEKEFLNLLSDKDIGFIKIIEIFQEVVEGIMFSGLSPEEIANRKKAIAESLKK